MTKVKNVRAGIVIIADAKIKLAPGESVEIEKPSPQTEQAIADGLLARMDDAPPAKPDTKPEGKPKSKTAASGTESKETAKKGKGQPAKEEQPQTTEENSEQKPEDQSGQGQLIEAGDALK